MYWHKEMNTVNEDGEPVQSPKKNNLQENRASLFALQGMLATEARK